MQQNFSIYRSSAGSGKTYTLAKEYLLLALRFRADYFKHILAVTFTNKSTQEMKNRILDYLDDFINNRERTKLLAAELKNTLKLDDNTFLENVNEVRSEILHKYDSFSISTIDAFFQKVIRSFTREAGLGGDYRLEVEHDLILEEVIDNLIEELGSNDELTHWVVEFARVNLENERHWDVRHNLIAFANEIFKEEFRNIETDFYKTTERPGYFKTFLDKLNNTRNQYIASIQPKCQLLYKTVKQHGLSAEDFKGKSRGIFSLLTKLNAIKQLRSDEVKELNKDLSEWLDASEWPHPKSPSRSQVFSLASGTLVPLLQEIINIHQQLYIEALSADVVLSNFYVFRLTADITRKLVEYKKENNTLLLADAPTFLNGIIQDSDTPFIYEKVGSFYRNYLIDEFQDTSYMQWKNFLPLLTNSLDQGYSSLVVGDVKQAIYRWRGGDLKLLQETIEQQIGTHRTAFSELDKNFRSAPTLVEFNNAIFKSTSAWVAAETETPLAMEVYQDADQLAAKEGKGLVHVDFFKKEKPVEDDDGDGDDEKEADWEEQALVKIPYYFEQLQDRGVELRHIALLVRNNKDGQKIASYLLQYKDSTHTESKYKYDVISNESLLIEGATTVKLLVSALQYLFNTDNSIARAQLSYEFARLHEPDRALTDVFTVANQAVFENNLPPAFTQEKSTLRKLPLFELTESLIRIFDLGSKRGELIYLQTFQDVVLDFYTREKNDLGAFLEWWEINKSKKSIQVSGEINAAQIITIHKSKGLQFPYVIIPFCSWNLNHEGFKSPTLWVKSDESIFADAGYVPVKYSTTLLHTHFAKFYKEERARCYLDNLNLLYVALTRAEKGLIVMAPYPISKKRLSHTAAGLLYNSFETAESLQPHWNAGALYFHSGDWPDHPAQQEKITGALSLHEYVVSPWREKLIIRQSGKTFFEDSLKDVRNKIDYGIHMHAILSRIRYTQEIPDALDKLVSEGLIAPSEKINVNNQLNQLLQDPLIASWFTPDWDVRTEVPILLPGGAENRIDRLLLSTASDNKKAVIIDFKTGKKSKQDRQQVVDYIALLHNMNFVSVEGYLLYLQNKEIIAVHASDKTTAPKTRDENQLGLF